MDQCKKPTVVIVGAGFGGLWAAKALRNAPARVVLIDRTNHHVFQPLLYQVAAAALSPADIAQPIRHILRGQRNLDVLMAEVVAVDAAAKEVWLAAAESPNEGSSQHVRRIPFDYLVLAPGSRHSYFGHGEWEPHAPGLKTLEDATAMRSKVLYAFERAEMEPDPTEQSRWMTFVVVGGGPTGVELAGAIAEIAFRALAREFDHVDPRSAKVILVEAGPRLLPSFPESLSESTRKSLEAMGVEVRTGTRVVDVGAERVATSEGDIPAKTVLWAAGNEAAPAAKWLNVPSDCAGRVIVEPDCSVPGYPQIFVIGDAMVLPGKDGQPLPGVAQVAMQQGVYVARQIANELRATGSPATQTQRSAIRNSHRPPFRYVDKGIMATIGRRRAVCVLGGRRFSGGVAWFLWLTVHICYLIGFPNKLLVLVQWTWSYVTFQRPARLITGTRREWQG